MSRERDGRFDDRCRYGRPQHEPPDGTREAELYGPPQHRERESDSSESPAVKRWMPSQ